MAGNVWFCLASGPSLTVRDAMAVRGHGVVAVTCATAFTAPWADILYAPDGDFWAVYGPKLEWFRGRRVGSQWARGYPEVEVRRVVKEPGLGRNGCLHSGGNAGYQLINLAYSEGARTIVLLGYDMRRGPNDEVHHHAPHPSPLGNAEGVVGWRQAFPALARDLRDEGVRVINSTRRTALECFECMPLARALEAV